METLVVAVPSKVPLGRFGDDGDSSPPAPLERLREWHVSPYAREALAALEPAARLLQTGDTPVAFPTETVYGLGADATRSASVRAIYAAKGRPSDNPLIVHVADLGMLGALVGAAPADAMPALYWPLVEHFWPGPLTILLPVPAPSPLAPEVTAGLPTFSVRMPASPLARTLIKLAGIPLAAPSANASTRPSPTTARHVADDLAGRIGLVLDGGPCGIGIESTVVDGLCDPPAVLRPGGVAIDDLRRCPGWHGVVKAYKDRDQSAAAAAPRAPGMKYKHYSSQARVVLYEASCRAASAGIGAPDAASALPPAHAPGAANGHAPRTIGVIRTKRWQPGAGLSCAGLHPAPALDAAANREHRPPGTPYHVFSGELSDPSGEAAGHVYDIGLGTDTTGIAQGLFSALRELDQRGADTIFVDGIDDDELDMAAAVMNRLRKAASETRT